MTCSVPGMRTEAKMLAKVTQEDPLCSKMNRQTVGLYWELFPPDFRVQNRDNLEFITKLQKQLTGFHMLLGSQCCHDKITFYQCYFFQSVFAE